MKPRIYYMDYLRTIAIIGVLSIHAAAPYATMYQKVDFSMWKRVLFTIVYLDGVCLFSL